LVPVHVCASALLIKVSLIWEDDKIIIVQKKKAGKDLEKNFAS